MVPGPLGGKGGLRVLPLSPYPLDETSNGNLGGCQNNFRTILTRFSPRVVLLWRVQKCNPWCVRSNLDAHETEMVISRAGHRVG